MKITYKGFEISVTRERAMGGWGSTYFYMTHLETGLMLEDSFSEETVRDQMNYLKGYADFYAANDFHIWTSDVLKLAEEQGQDVSLLKENCDMMRDFVRGASPADYLEGRGFVSPFLN